jgi:hypothetical protein
VVSTAQVIGKLAAVQQGADSKNMVHTHAPVITTPCAHPLLSKLLAASICVNTAAQMCSLFAPQTPSTIDTIND